MPGAKAGTSARLSPAACWPKASGGATFMMQARAIPAAEALSVFLNVDLRCTMEPSQNELHLSEWRQRSSLCCRSDEHSQWSPRLGESMGRKWSLTMPPPKRYRVIQLKEAAHFREVSQWGAVL